MSDQRIGLCLEPLDVLFFRDGRPFLPATRGRSGLPMPQTLAGAFWTALLERAGCDFDILAQKLNQGADYAEAIDAAGAPPWIAQVAIRGPWLARHVDGGKPPEVLLPVPAVLRRRKGNARDKPDEPLLRVRPIADGQLPGWVPPESGVRPLWLTCPEATESLGGYVKPAGMRAFLADQPVLAKDVITESDLSNLFDFDNRTGIAIEPDRLSAKEGEIYGISLLALQPHVGLYAEVTLAKGQTKDMFADLPTLNFGGEGRRVRLRVLDEPFDWPQVQPSAEREKPMVVLTTPGIFSQGWKPLSVNGHLAAAAVPGSVAVSGWDLAHGGPKPNRFAAAGGSTYFLDTALQSWPDSLSDDPKDRQQGWGCYLRGVWTDE
jgi:CRISPR-associated protein Cmr3